MANTIQHKRSSTSGVAPVASGLSQGELAINIADGKLYTKNNANTVINLGVTSISGTYITPSSGNFFDYLAVNGVPVSVSGHSHTTVQQAESLVTTVFNETGSTLSKMTAVYINGGHGDRPTIQKAIATSDATSAGTYGLVYADIDHNQEGQIIVFGSLSGVNTDPANGGIAGATEGSVLYLSPTTSGAITTTKPYAPDHIVAIGTVVRVHQNEGIIEVRVQNGFELDELHNVAISGATNGQFLQYNSTNGLWVPSSSGNFSSLTINNAQIVTGTGIANHVAYWNSTSGIVADSGQLYWDSTNNRLGIGTSSPTNVLSVVGTEGVFSVAGSDLTYGGQSPTINLKGYTWFGKADGSVGIGAHHADATTFGSSVGFFLFEGFNENVTAYTPICLAAGYDPQLFLDTSLNVGISTANPSAKLDVNGTTKSQSFTSTRVNNPLSGSGQIYLNGSLGNRIDFNINGIASPSFTNRSVGTKIVLYPGVGASTTDYALGLETNGIWFSVPQTTSRQFRWYAGTTNITTLTGAGVLTVAGGTSQINVDGLRLDNNILSVTTVNDDLILKPNGNGALLADNTGNTRGIYSVDLQRDRVSVSEVAIGPYSVIAGGASNTTSNNYSTVGGGQGNTASNAWAVVCGGELNVASGNRSTVCGGGNNTSSNLSTTIGGGQFNVSDGQYSTVPGGFRGKTTRHGELSHGAGMFANTGDAQHTILIARKQTTDATANVVLTLNGLAPVSTNILNIPAQTMWTFSIKLSAYNLANNEGAWWIFRGGIKRNNTNDTVLVGNLISENGFEGSLSGATATVVADNINQALEIRVTGIAGKSIRWVAVADISQVSFGVI